ncbi:MAG: serine/threonine-protein phosphatase [Pseudomonadales bacterium]|nr:serine/threonine-protein phosphatase [Pseudomonadales bacterium]
MTILLIQPEHDSSVIQSLEFLAEMDDVLAVSGLPSARRILHTDSAEFILFYCSTARAFTLCETLIVEFPDIPVAALLPTQEFSQDALRDALRIGLEDVIELGTQASPSLEEVISRLKKRIHRRHAHRAPPASLPDEHARQLEHDQRSGSYVQSQMLPVTPITIGAYRMSHKVLPTLYMSGDFVDYFRITDDFVLFYMADVSGHGAGSAFVTVMLKNFLDQISKTCTPAMLDEPGVMLSQLNKALLGNRLDKHVSMFLGVVDLENHILNYSNAGHFPHGILVDLNGSQFIEMNGKPVGLFENVSYASAKLELGDDSQLVLVSDGILEFLPGEDLVAKEMALLDKVTRAKQQKLEIWELFDLAEILGASDDISFLTVTRTG